MHVFPDIEISWCALVLTYN